MYDAYQMSTTDQRGMYLTSDLCMTDHLIGYRMHTLWVYHNHKLYGLNINKTTWYFKMDHSLKNFKVSNHCRCNKLYHSLCVY